MVVALAVLARCSGRGTRAALLAGSWKLEAGSWKLEAGSWKTSMVQWDRDRGKAAEQSSSSQTCTPPTQL
ncbi:MAG TPA: hypothetical protein EYH51_16765 [Pseudomonas pachastrellae]|nr:hypothetical protein [Halopseudomonas pachastrellae]